MYNLLFISKRELKMWCAIDTDQQHMAPGLWVQGYVQPSGLLENTCPPPIHRPYPFALAPQCHHGSQTCYQN